MIVSEARILANRANAAKSSGPKTPEGKERSRANAVKHGLTGEGIAIAREEAEAIDRRFAGFRADYQPVTEAGVALVLRAAVLSVRLERSAVHEAAAIARNVGAAESDFDEAREAEVDALFASMAENPAPAHRKLLRRPEGIQRMIETWADLHDDLTLGDGSRWTEGHAAMALNLVGRKAGGFGVARVEALSRAFAGDFDLLQPDDGAGLDPRARRQWARRALAALIDAEALGLEAHGATLDLEAIAADRARAGAVALFDPSKEATLARKYEAAADRAMHRALQEMKAVEAEAAATPRPDHEPIAPPSPAPSMGSFSPRPAHRPEPPAPAPSASRIGAEIDSTFVPITIGRAATVRY